MSERKTRRRPLKLKCMLLVDPAAHLFKVPLPPDGVFTFVSENGLRVGFAATGEDRDCPRFGRENGVSLEVVCKTSCVAQSTCNGITGIYHGGEKWCILRSCSNSQQPFLTNDSDSEGAPWNFFGLTTWQERLPLQRKVRY